MVIGLIHRSGYIPWIVGIVLIINGAACAGFLFITFFGELLFMLWLLIRGWKIPEPA